MSKIIILLLSHLLAAGVSAFVSSAAEYERGFRDGRHSGLLEGYRNGYDACCEEVRRDADR